MHFLFSFFRDISGCTWDFLFALFNCRHSRKPWSKFINVDNQHLAVPEVDRFVFYCVAIWNLSIKEVFSYGLFCPFLVEGHGLCGQVAAIWSSGEANCKGGNGMIQFRLQKRPLTFWKWDFSVGTGALFSVWHCVHVALAWISMLVAWIIISKTWGSVCAEVTVLKCFSSSHIASVVLWTRANSFEIRLTYRFSDAF